MTKEQKFYKALQDVFIGAKIEGEGGFVKLMKIKSNYYRKIEDILKKDIESAIKAYPSFRDELFDKLYSFFSRYFTESGSIYFNSTPFHNNIYEKVYTDEKDVILFWKTQMLYYVKTDRIFRSLPVEFPSDRGVDAKGGQGVLKFYFDASKIETKKANEKRSLIYELKEVKEDKTIVFDVQYSEKGRITKTNDILNEFKKKHINITEEQLERAFRVFEKQSEVDFFINKNAKAFLQEQFKLWSYQYFWEGAGTPLTTLQDGNAWSADRVNQLQILKNIAFKIIDFISQFEDELVKIWNKPKFVKNSNYVITLDRILSACHYRENGNSYSLIKKILEAEGIKSQIKEWQELGIVDKEFTIKDIFETDLTGEHLAKKYEHLPIDTKYFKDLELEILSQFDDLDKSLDGWLIKSENYQALNTILPKFKEKVQTIYIDPPFNTGDDFSYVDRFQDSSWLSLMKDRLELGKGFLNKRGNFFLHLDQNANYYGRILMNYIFNDDNFRNEIIWKYFGAGQSEKQLKRKHDNIYFFAISEDNYFSWKAVAEKLGEKQIAKYSGIDELGRKFKEYKHKDGKVYRKYLDTENDLLPSIDVWEIPIIQSWDEKIKVFDTQKPEKLIEKIISASSELGTIIFDFFLGSGTTTAVAHKLGRKWLGVEMGEHFYNVVLPRMKKVLDYDKSGISKEVKEYQGGGFFKYYELEQYEETLANCKYEDGDLFNSPLIKGWQSEGLTGYWSIRTPYQEYVFMKDEKMLKALEIDYENNKVKVDLTKLYPNTPSLRDTPLKEGNIDIAETLSNLTGKWIKKITPLPPLQEGNYEVEFEDGTKIDTKDLDYKLIKPLIWW